MNAATGRPARQLPPCESDTVRRAGLVSLALLAIAGVIGWFVAYAMQSSGASRVTALFAAGLVAMGSLLLGWSYVRRPTVGQNDDALDKLLAGAGQALLLGAVLTFGFGIVGQHLDDERAGLDRQRGRGTSTFAGTSDPGVCGA